VSRDYPPAAFSPLATLPAGISGMSRPIVHVGYAKTATTWFQKSFYPRVKSHSYVARDIVRSALIAPNALSFDGNAARGLLIVGDRPAVVCEEGLVGYLHNGGVAGMVTREFAERIRKALPEAQIVIFLRSQPSAIAAAYQQYVRGGGTHTPHRFIFPQDYLIGSNAETYKQPRFDIDHFRYSHLIDMYETLFGADNVNVFLFEAFQRDRTAFLRTYTDALGIDIDFGTLPMEPRLPTYGLALTHFARFLNFFTARSVIDKDPIIHIPGWYRARRYLLETMNRTHLFGARPSPARLLGDATVKWLEGYFADDNRRLAERGLAVADHGYPLTSQEGRIERPTAGRWRKWLAS
jgi:hypothetical protein